MNQGNKARAIAKTPRVVDKPPAATKAAKSAAKFGIKKAKAQRPSQSRAALKPKAKISLSKTLHPRNIHNHGYDFSALTQSLPQLSVFVRPNPYGDVSIDFADPQAVKTLNAALLKHHYGIDYWDIPQGALCPPIPGRVDYVHYIADLLAEGEQALTLSAANVLDIGTGANAIYPILGSQVYGWQFVATDINAQSLENVQKLVGANKNLQGKITLRLQPNAKHVFKQVIQAEDRFELTLCNPPFHASLAEASAGSERKNHNLQANRRANRGLMPTRGHGQTAKPMASAAKLNFGGQGAELWCQGGEPQFLATMLTESAAFSRQCLWFTSLVSKQENLKACYQLLAKLGVDTVKTLEMQQGNKITRVLAWTFHSALARQAWRDARLKG